MEFFSIVGYVSGCNILYLGRHFPKLSWKLKVYEERNGLKSTCRNSIYSLKLNELSSFE